MKGDSRPKLKLALYWSASRGGCDVAVLEHYPKERAEALEHLDFAIAEFRDMKMQPSLEPARCRLS